MQPDSVAANAEVTVDQPYNTSCPTQTSRKPCLNDKVVRPKCLRVDAALDATDACDDEDKDDYDDADDDEDEDGDDDDDDDGTCLCSGFFSACLSRKL